MQLMDDALFKHWQEQRVVLEEVLAKAHSPDELAKRVLNYQKGIMDDPNNPNAQMAEGGPPGGKPPYGGH
jgi:twitching motility protein PilT